MSTSEKIWLITAAFLVIVGLIVFVSALSYIDWDFGNLNSAQYETNTYEISEEFDNISLDTETADIIFYPSDDGKCKVVCYEQTNMKHSVSVSNGNLTVNVADDTKWYDHIFVFSLNFTSPKITVYLPKSEYAVLSIKDSTGDIEIPKGFNFEKIDISATTGGVECSASVSGLIKIGLSTGGIKLDGMDAGELDLSTSTGSINLSSVSCENDINISVATGRVKLSDAVCKSMNISVTTGKTEMNDIACKNLTSTGSTGTISLNNVIADENMQIKRTTGSIKFDRCDSGELFIKTSTGSVKGSLLTDKIFIAHSNTGSVNVPKTVSGGRCEITTNTGNIKIDIQS